VSDLKGKSVTLFPAKGYYDKWKAKGETLNIHRLKISKLTETLPVHDGGDLADYLPKYASIPESRPMTETLKDGRVIQLHAAGFPADWV
jgi:hypothetical protein